jgi:hypothetical protein
VVRHQRDSLSVIPGFKRTIIPNVRGCLWHPKPRAKVGHADQRSD